MNSYWASMWPLCRGRDEGSTGGSSSIHLPSPGPFPDRLQCLSLSIVSNETCRAVFPGRITDNMVCAGGEAGEDACQVSDLQGTPRTGGRGGKTGWGGGSRKGKSERGDGEREAVRKKERHRKRQGESPGSGGQREGAQVQSRRDLGWGTKGGRAKGSGHSELRQVTACLSSPESSPYHPSSRWCWPRREGLEGSLTL